MERRGMSWRSIPPELGVPTVMAALIDLIGLTVAPERGGRALALATGLTRHLLILYGLVLLRRRGAGRASPLLAIGAALQGVAAAGALGVSLTAVMVQRGAWLSAYGPLRDVLSGAALGFAVAMIAAARAWRSPLAPIAILTSLAWYMPHELGVLVYAPLHGASPELVFALAMLAAQVALLGLFARLEDPQAPADPTGAERGALRIALTLRLRAALVAAGGVVVVVLISRGPGVWTLALGGVFGLAALGVVVGQISGLLAMAAARLATLSSPGLYVAGFAALWDVLFNTAKLALLRGRTTSPLAVLAVVIGLFGMVVGAWAVHGVAGLRRDRELRGAIANRVGWIIALGIVHALTICLLPERLTAHGAGLMLVSLVCQVSALLLLAGLFARIAGRIQVNAAADVF